MDSSALEYSKIDSVSGPPADHAGAPAYTSNGLTHSEPHRITMGVGTVLRLRAAGHSTQKRHPSGLPALHQLATVAAAFARLAASEDAAGE